jgi:hypothetical protein
MKFLLTYGMDFTDSHQPLVAACVLAMFIIALSVAP